MPVPTRTLHTLAEEVKTLQEQDDALTKARAKTKVEQRDLRLLMGTKVTGLTDAEYAYVSDRVGLTVSRLKDYAFVRAQWPDGTFPADSNYTALEELARDADRFTKIKPGMSKRDARAAKGGKVDTPSRWSDDVKADFIKEALATNPEVARQIAEDQAARAAVAEANLALLREQQAKAGVSNPARAAMRKQTDKDRVHNALDNVRYALGKILSDAMEQGLGGDAETLEHLSEVTLMHDGLRSYLERGNTDFDADLSALLEENS